MRRDATTVLFDLDGTLIDSVELILRSYRHTLEVHRGTTPPDDVWLAGLGTPLWTQFRKFTEDREEIAAMVQTYREHNLAHHDALVREYPGVLESVRELSRRDVPLGIVTSKTRAATLRGLTHCGYDGLFATLVCADDVQRHKPDPEPVTRALTLMDADPTHTVFVGDSPHDLTAGRAAGVATAAVLWGPFSRQILEPHAPDHWIEESVGSRKRSG
jgi:pyrophosphatase PpaX